MDTEKRILSIAIDGPSGAGKSTLARAAAKELNLLYVDTGAIYRTVALHTLRRGVEPRDAAVEALLPEIDLLVRHMTELREAIGTGDGDRLEELLRQGREAKEHIDALNPDQPSE